MPTLSGESHEQRTVAESFGADADRYDRARPTYPAALITRILAAAPGREVLDVGCGTGIVARQLQAAGATVLGLDPDPRMAAVARRSGLDVVIATIEEWEPAGRTFDALVAGQTWHWVDPARGAAAAARLLRPGGLITMFWNGVEPPPEVGEATGAALRRFLPDLPGPKSFSFGGTAYAPLAEKAAAALRATGAFAEPELWTFPWQRPYTRDEWAEQISTSGFINRLPPETLTELRAAIRAETPAAFTAGYSTVAAAAHRLAADAPVCA
ncbi:methyltransferase domain-containing protein [Dactylosporangium vinaceum]|uniref:Class I SAM-dependent methyltransferase n=1 Tax=Dactylosporangium vinaceum TaxID=53362 RepID=A0ABV5MGC2_9ACTN|nr:class I SAM-dependent methyltransferase [Dactylosporangium vinaceum]UAB98999.1 methyltransferase domain-containing protein [Dactylosporangium vinaceum]